MFINYVNLHGCRQGGGVGLVGLSPPQVLATIKKYHREMVLNQVYCIKKFPNNVWGGGGGGWFANLSKPNTPHPHHHTLKKLSMPISCM